MAEIEAALLPVAKTQTFKHAEQQEVFRTVLSAGLQPTLIIVPTGSGKSLLYQLTAYVSHRKSLAMNVIVIPYKALLQDALQQARQLGLRSFIWTSGMQHTHVDNQLVFVLADIAIGEAFLTYLHQLQHQNWLARVFFDECHVPWHNSKFRSRLAGKVQKLFCDAWQTILMTATAPPEDLDKMLSWFTALADQTVTFRSSETVRCNIQYSVLQTSIAELIPDLQESISQAMSSLSRGDRILIFVASCSMGYEISEALNCLFYYANMNEPMKAQLLRDFTSTTSSTQLLVATSALTHGINYAAVRYVIHAEIPRSLLEFVQESGRAGRDGKPAKSIIFNTQTRYSTDLSLYI